MLKKNEIAAFGSAFACNEDNYVLMKLMRHLGMKRINFIQHTEPNDQDTLLLRADKTPNAAGAHAVGIEPAGEADLQSILKEIDVGTIKALYVIEDDIYAVPGAADTLAKLDFLIVHASIENSTTREADVVLSSSTYAEKNGTFTNFQGRVQRVRPAVATAEQDRAVDGFSMSRLDKFGAQNDRWMKGTKRDARPTWRILLAIANALGARWNEITAQIPSFKGLSYLRIGTRGMMLQPDHSSSVLRNIGGQPGLTDKETKIISSTKS
jgi:NADH-quinone oxidoreductase subunit G